MATILQHLPGFVDGTPEQATFDTLEELLALPFVAEWRAHAQPWGNAFYRYSLSQDVAGAFLMAEFDKGAEWYVIGTLTDAVDGRLTSLPRWEEPPESPDD